MSGKRLITFEISESHDVLDVHMNREGIAELIACLRKLAETVELPEHDHLMTEEWGGHELDSEKQNEMAILLNKVNLRLWD